MCSRKWLMPVVPGTSLRPPTWYQTHSEMTGACRASSAYSTSPFSRRRVAGASVAVGMKKMVAARRFGGLAPEPCGKQRFHGDGRVDGPEHARALGVFIQDRDHRDRWLLERRESDEPSIDLPGGRGLGRPTLTGGADGVAAEDRRDRPVEVVRHRMHAVADEREVGRDALRGTGLRLGIGLHGLAIAVAHLDDEARLPDDAVVRESRRVICHLERRREQEPLAD